MKTHLLIANREWTGRLRHRVAAALPALTFVCALTAGEIRRVPEDYPTVLAAYGNAASGDTILIQPQLYREVPPAVFSGAKQVLLQSAGGKVIIVHDTQPLNDQFAARTVLTGTSFSTTAFNYTATTLPTDLPPSAGDDVVLYGRSLWWSWTTPDTTLVVVNTVGSRLDLSIGPAGVQPGQAWLEVFRGDDYPPPPWR